MVLPFSGILFVILVLEILVYLLYKLLGGQRNVHKAVFIIPLCAAIFFETKYSIDKKNELMKAERLKNDSLRKAFIKDSIEHDPRHQDSIRRTEELWKERDRISKYYEAREIVGIVYGNDTIYHSCIHSVHYYNDWPISTNYLDDDKDDLWFVTRKEAKRLGIKECEECKEINLIYSSYEDGDLIWRDDIQYYIEDISDD